MSTGAASDKRKRSWRDYLRAFGRAHRKASVQLESSRPLLDHLNELRQTGFQSFPGGDHHNRRLALPLPVRS